MTLSIRHYQAILGNVSMVIDGTSAAFALFDARRRYGPDVQLTDYMPIESNVIDLKQKKGEASPCQYCLIYLSRCHCTDAG